MKRVATVVSIMAALALGVWAEGEGEGQGKGHEQRKGPPEMGGDRAAKMEQMKQEMRKKLDTNGDGQISPEEKAAGETARKELLEAQVMEHFTAMDADGNGCISKEEWIGFARKQHEARTSAGGDRNKERAREGNREKHGEKGNNGVGNGVDAAPPGTPPVNDGEGTGPGNPGNKGGANE